MSQDRPLLALEIPPGERVARIACGGPPFERGTSYEPSLLPHLARLCHDFSIGEMVLTARTICWNEGHPLGWPQLWESTVTTLFRRFAPEKFDNLETYLLTRIEVETYRYVLGFSSDFAQIRDRIRAEAPWNESSLVARVIATLSTPASIADFVSNYDSIDVDAEGIRSVLVAADRVGIAIDPAWIDRAVGRDQNWIDRGRVAHILPAIQRAELRAELAHRLVEQTNSSYEPAWYLALVVSRIAPHLSQPIVWDFQYFGESELPWRALIERLLGADAAETLAADVLRAHPFSSDLAAIEGPHESTERAPQEIMDAWAGAPPPGSLSNDADFLPELGDEEEPMEPQQPIQDDRRLGVDAYTDGKRLKNALIAGRQTEIEVSIGKEATVQLTTPITIDFGDADRLTLRVRFVYGETELWERMRISRDPTKSASVTFEILPEGSPFNALIVVYNDDISKVIEAVAYEAEVLPTEQEEQESPPTMKLLKVPIAAIGGPLGESGGSIVTDGERAAVAAPDTPIPVTPSAAVRGVAPVTSAFRTAAQNYVATGGAFDITGALIEAAQLGYRLRKRLGLEALRDLDRIQVVSLYPESIFPLELVYDGEPPSDTATLCRDWLPALEEGNCPTCTDLSDTSRVCPLRFWGLSKVIEHHVGSTTGNVPFSARELLPVEAQPLSPPSSTLIGASSRVLEALAPAATASSTSSRDPAGGDPATVLGELVSLAADLGSCSIVDDWDEWRHAIGETAPNLLVAMPHQDTEGVAPALELGGELETTFVESHVRRVGESPGPIVLLLGCDTSNAPDLIGTFAGDIRSYAPVVVATIGKVVAREAPLVAAAIIENLQRASEKKDATIGAALLATRRALLADSRLVGLLLVGHGDARWEVRPS